MGRPAGLIGILTVSLFWGCGCSAPGQLSMTKLFHRPHREKSADKASRIAKANPLRRKGDHQRSPATRTPSVGAVTQSGSHQSVAQQATADRRSLIRSMIDAEMTDASTSERETMFENVRDLEPAFAKQVLSMNRLVRQMGQHAPSQQRLQTADTADVHRGRPTAQSDLRAGSVERTRSSRSAQLGTANGSSPVMQTAGMKSPIPPPAAIGANPWTSGVSSRRGANLSSQQFPIENRNGIESDRFPSQQLVAAALDRRPTGKTPLAAGGRHDFGRPTVSFDANAGSINPADAVGDAASNLSLAEWHDGLTRLIVQAETVAARNRPGNNASPTVERDYIEKQVYLRMLYLMNDQRSRSIEPIYGIDAADQEFWQQMFWAIAGYFDRRTIPDPRKRATETLASLQKAVRDLQPKAELKLANAAFCHKITSYGNYKTFDRNEFRPGRPILLYVEVANFASERTADNRFRTILKSTIEIMDPAGNVLQKIPFPATEDLCRNYRRDYFHSYEFAIPESRTIGFGPHKVRLTVQDELSGQLATYTLNFNVTGN